MMTADHTPAMNQKTRVAVLLCSMPSSRDLAFLPYASWMYGLAGSVVSG